jgi:hypothetical protein
LFVLLAMAYPFAAPRFLQHNSGGGRSDRSPS